MKWKEFDFIDKISSIYLIIVSTLLVIIGISGIVNYYSNQRQEEEKRNNYKTYLVSDNHKYISAVDTTNGDTYFIELVGDNIYKIEKVYDKNGKPIVLREPPITADESSVLNP